jgi:hypothetical protein
MNRRYSHSYEDFALPWQLEVALWVLGLICGLLARWLVMYAITSRAAAFGMTLGVRVETQTIIGPVQPLLWVFALIVGVRIRCWLRRIVIKRVSNII